MELVLDALGDGVEDVTTVAGRRVEERVCEGVGLVQGRLVFVPAVRGVPENVGGVVLEVEGEGFVIMIFIVEITIVFVIVFVDVE